MLARRLILTVALLALPGALHAQGGVTGVVRDAVSSAPITGAVVVILSAEGVELQARTTAADGRYVFSPITPGRYHLRAAHLGFRPAVRPDVSVRAGQVARLDLALEPNPVPVAEVRVTGTQRSRAPLLAGYYQRLDRGLGRFVTRDDIEKRRPGRVTDLLRELPGLRVACGSGVAEVSIDRVLDRRCRVQLFLNGVLMNRPTQAQEAEVSGLGVGGGELSAGERAASEITGADIDVDALATPSEVEGIEVYSGISSTPMEFLGRNARCGTIAIWTRMP